MVQVYCSTLSNGLDIKEAHDPSAVLDYVIQYKPDLYKTNFQYSKGDVVLPTLFSGYYLECIDSGISGSIEPTSPAEIGETTTDNTVEWITKQYNFYLDYLERIEVDGLGGYLSSWVATNSVTIGSRIDNDRSSKIWVQTIPAGVVEFSLTHHFTTTFGRVDERTLNIKVKNR